MRKPEGGEMPLLCISPLDRKALGAKNKRARFPLPSYLALAHQSMNQIENEAEFKPDQAGVGQLEELEPVHRW